MTERSHAHLMEKLKDLTDDEKVECIMTHIICKAIERTMESLPRLVRRLRIPKGAIRIGRPCPDMRGFTQTQIRILQPRHASSTPIIEDDEDIIILQTISCVQDQGELKAYRGSSPHTLGFKKHTHTPALMEEGCASKSKGRGL